MGCTEKDEEEVIQARVHGGHGINNNSEELLWFPQWEERGQEEDALEGHEIMQIYFAIHTVIL